MQDAKSESFERSEADLNDTYIDEYWATYRQHVHTLLAWGYTDSLLRVQANNQQEPDITGFIAEAIKERLDDVASPSWCDQIALEDDPPVPGGGRAGRSRWRPDLIFESTERRPRPRYHFEAKRLNKSQSKDEYIGEDGLGCFLSGKYASNNFEAGMLGYVQSDDINTWITKLQLTIEHSRLNDNKLLVLSSPYAIHIIDSFPDEWISKHNRATGKPVTVHHILLDYRVP